MELVISKEFAQVLLNHFTQKPQVYTEVAHLIKGLIELKPVEAKPVEEAKPE